MDESQIQKKLEHLIRKYYGINIQKVGSKGRQLYYVLRGPQDENFCESCKKIFEEAEYNIYSDFSECCYCLACFFKGRLDKKDQRFIQRYTRGN